MNGHSHFFSIWIEDISCLTQFEYKVKNIEGKDQGDWMPWYTLKDGKVTSLDANNKILDMVAPLMTDVLTLSLLTQPFKHNCTTSWYTLHIIYAHSNS